MMFDNKHETLLKSKLRKNQVDFVNHYIIIIFCGTEYNVLEIFRKIKAT